MNKRCTALFSALLYMEHEDIREPSLDDIGLTPRQREICRMYFVQGMNQVDIAEAIHIEQQTVSEHLKASNAKIKKLGLNPLVRKVAPSFSRNQSQFSRQLALV